MLCIVPGRGLLPKEVMRPGIGGGASSAAEPRWSLLSTSVARLQGGTSTDVSRYAGRYEHVFESTTAGVTIQAPQLDINTVAAGGGSRLFFQSGVFRVSQTATRPEKNSKTKSAST